MPSEHLEHFIFSIRRSIDIDYNCMNAIRRKSFTVEFLECNKRCEIIHDDSNCFVCFLVIYFIKFKWLRK